MTIGAEQVAAAARRAASAFETHEAELNAADGRLGDGDTGAMLKRLSAAIAAVELKPDAPLGDVFRSLAMAASSATGSSLGTLVMTALMSFAKGTAGRGNIEPSELGTLLDGAIEAALKRGGAQPGDKTVIDSAMAVAAALKDGQPPAPAAHAALDAFRDRENRIGRAARYGSKSRGLDDPGMLAFAILCDALAE